jgi:hypothetical protein
MNVSIDYYICGVEYLYFLILKILFNLLLVKKFLFHIKIILGY